MQISGIDSKTGLISSIQSLDPNVIQLIEKLKSSPLLIQKLQLSDSKTLTLTPENTTLLKQLQLPITTTKALASLANQMTKIEISVKDNHIMLQLIPKTITPDQLKPITLLFKQAAITEHNTLVLKQLVPTSINKAIDTLTNQSSRSHSAHPTQQNKHIADETITLKQAIKELLTGHTHDNKKIASHLNQLFTLKNQLTDSFNGKTMNQLEPQLLQLTPKSYHELLNKISRLMPNHSSFINHINKTILLTDKLQQSVDFSATNKSLNIENRVNISGSFFESNLNKNYSEPNDKQLGLDQQTNHILKNKSHDIKQIILQLRQTLLSALNHLGIKNEQPIHAQRLIQTLLNSTEFKILVNALPTADSPTASTSQQNTTHQALTNEIKSLFISKELNQLFLNDKLKPEYQLTPLNKRLNTSLLTVQKQVIDNMLNEVNTTLSKIEHNQLLSLKNESSFLQQYLIDLPIYHKGKVESFELLFESEQKNNSSQKNKTWTITVRFDLEPLGPMYAKISLQNDKISTHFSAQEESTAKLLVEHIDRLKDSLFLAGLNVKEIQGCQSNDIPETLLKNDDNTIDVHI